MNRYIDRDKLCDFARINKDGTIDCNDIMRFPTTEIEELAPRYIDANTAIKSFKDSHIEGNCYTPNFIIEFFEKQPTADVQEVRHGHWMLSDETDVWKCSECGHLTSERIFKQYRDINGNTCYQSENPFYCSLCGAKMDL